MKMISMAMKKEGKGKSDACCCGAPCDCESDKPRYPWGLQLHLENEQLETIGMKEMPKVGETMTMQVKVKVTSCGEQEREGSEASRNVSLQIIEIGTEAPAMSEKEKVGAMYGSMKDMEA